MFESLLNQLFQSVFSADYILIDCTINNDSSPTNAICGTWLHISELNNLNHCNFRDDIELTLNND